MSFNPINDDHAVQSVAFSVHFDRPFDQGIFQKIQSQHQRWQPDLPAMQLPQMFGFEIGPAGPTPKPIVGNGVEFSYLRPDGTPAWQLRFDVANIVVECTRYSRWARVWQSAKKHLETALEVIDTAGDLTETSIAGFSLQCIDRFVGKSSGNDLKSIFCENKYMAKSLFEFGDFWHNHLGWFDGSLTLGAVLNNLNFDAKNDPTVEGSPVVVDILHLQQLRFNEKPKPHQFRDQIDALFDSPMQGLHEKNKALISSLLQPEMGRRIGITSKLSSERTEP